MAPVCCASLKTPDYVNTQMFYTSPSHCWTRGVSSFAVKSVLSVCDLEALSLHITLVFAEY